MIKVARLKITVYAVGPGKQDMESQEVDNYLDLAQYAMNAVTAGYNGLHVHFPGFSQGELTDGIHSLTHEKICDITAACCGTAKHSCVEKWGCKKLPLTSF